MSVCFLSLVVAVSFASAQSTDQNYPSPVNSNEIVGRIKARDVGDSRVTSHYFAFDGGQGDIFVNVVTNNLEGSIDVFTVEGQRPLTKMVIYADTGNTETGRLVYLRKPERLLLRVEGRSPNDDPATYKIKFGGSFIASNSTVPDTAPKLADPVKIGEPGVKVNSVGTIITVIPKEVPVKKEPEKKVEVAKEAPRSTGAKPGKTQTTKTGSAKAEVVTPVKEKPATDKNEVVVSDSKAVEKTRTKAVAPSTKPVAKATPPTPKTVTPSTDSKDKADPMASIRLVVELKDGSSSWRPMSDVVKFGYDKGFFTVIGKDGSISKYAILDIAKVTMQ